LRQHGLADAISLYYEDQQYLASGVDRADVHARASAFVKTAIASPMLTQAPDQLRELKSKASQPADVQLWFLLFVSFQLFKTSPFWDNSQQHIVRLTTRDPTGKYTWDWNQCGEWEHDLALRKTAKDNRSTATVVDGNFDLLGGQTWRMDELTEGSEPVQTEVPDFETLLTGYKENPFKNSPDFFAPKQLMDETHALMLEYADAMGMQNGFVEQRIAEMAKEPGVTLACEPPQPATLLSQTHLTKNFLKQLGFLDSSKYSHFTLIDTESARFKRLIKQLDTATYGHEVTKIGLVYVKDGQENERSMLRNEEPDSSNLYQEFVRGMATIAPIARHCGYVGGLDRSGSVGTTLPYWRNAMNELVIHEVTRMPTIHKDPQQILKKRHVGNDIIHVIWSEHSRDYKPQTIVSQFNDAHIMIFPLPNGLFRIRVAQKREVAPFGPLIHNMAVPKELLPALARQTAVVANSVVRFSHEHYMGQFAARRNAVIDIVSKNPKPGYHDYVAACFPGHDMVVS